MTVQRIYESGEVAIRPGDTVVDCGAHVGLFTKLALKQGADRVVAIEPDPANVACLESNLGPEIAEGRVVVVKAGLWNKKTRLTFHESLDGNSGLYVNWAARQLGCPPSRGHPAEPRQRGWHILFAEEGISNQKFGLG